MIGQQQSRHDASVAAEGPAGQHYERLFHQAPCGYVTTGDDGRITSVNDTFLRWSGHRRDDLLGTPLMSLFAVGDRLLWSVRYVPVLALAGVVAEVAVDVIAADGRVLPGLLNASRTPQTGDRAAEVRVIVLSAGERRHYERELVAERRRAEESEGRRAQAEAELQHRVLHDPLTGLRNRAGLRVDLDRALARPARGQGLVFLDLDHFKAVNDSLGHAAGDELLVAVADRLRSVTRSACVVARLSGDEFVVLAELDDPDQLPVLAQRLLEVVHTPVVVQGLEVLPSASVGVAVAEVGDTADRLLHRADLAMYRAKAQGRNCWQLHDPRQPDATVDRLRVLGELRTALAGGQLRLHHQPQVDLSSGTVRGVETLVRWQHPRRGLLLPGEFIELAEDSGLIRALGAQVLETAVAQAATWQRDGQELEVAVNLSTRQVEDPDVVDLVRRTLDSSGLAPHRLTLEITETALMLDPAGALERLRALKGLGVRLSLDDFGTGYSSLTYLQRFPMDELKVDRSFVAQLGREHNASAIVASCISLAHGVGARAVAEGVETDAQLRMLVDLGCDVAQGYLLGRPVPAEQLALGVATERWTAARAGTGPGKP